MPTATATSIIGQFDTRSYTDTDQNLVVGTTYYVRIGSVKNGIEKISNEVTIMVNGIGTPYNLKGTYIL